MEKTEMMFFSERMALAEVLTEWRELQFGKIGWQPKDKDRLKRYYMDCVSILVALELIDIKKSRQFIADMEGVE